MMPHIVEDTIAAVATPPGEGGIAVIRLSGPEAVEIASRSFYPSRGEVRGFASHTVHLREIKNERGELIDRALLTFFKAPHSYTGEDVVELSAHGSLIAVKKILGLLIRLGARHAEPGEFTKRAFLNGKMDLAQAEAVLDLIKAKSEKALETAVRQLAGSLSHPLKSLKEELMKMLASMEAFLDFPDEHLEVFSNREFAAAFESIEKELNRLIGSFRRGSLLREGVRLVLVGKPNVGKSSLFNALLERDRALVSEYPGTTRDPLEEGLEIGGLYVRLTDTAGLGHPSENPVDRLGMDRTRQLLKEADLFLYVVDGSRPLEEADRLAFREIPAAKPFLVIAGKSDLGCLLRPEDLEQSAGTKDFVAASAKNGEGLRELETKIAREFLKGDFEKEGEQITRLRHKNALEAALDSLRRAQEAFTARASLEFVTYDLKKALEALRELVGEVHSEDLLDVIFAEFCIGK